MSVYSETERNLQEIRSRIRAAEERAGRSGTTLIAAVKYTDAEHIAALAKLGVREIGENRVQQLLEHREALQSLDLNYHFIGKLQTNKVKYIIDKVCLIHSVDTLSLAAEIEKQAAKRGLTMDILVEINSGREESKSGVMPEAAADFCGEVVKFPHLRLRGFMTMAPRCEKTEDYRKFFQETYQQGLDIWTKKLHNIGRPIFSMGMSESFEPAIEEGATHVRVGRSLFRVGQTPGDPTLHQEDFTA